MEVKNMDAVIQVRPGNNHGKNTGAGAGERVTDVRTTQVPMA